MRHPSTSGSLLFTFLLFSFFVLIVANLPIFCICVFKRRLKLKSRYKRRVEAATEYTKTIDDFNYLVDLRTLARHCLVPKPYSYVLRAIEIEEKSKCLFGSLLT